MKGLATTQGSWPRNSMIDTELPIVDHDRTSEAQLPWLEFLILISRRKRFIATGTLGCAVVALIIFLFVPNQYTATTLLLAPQQQQSLATALLSQAGGAGLLGSAAASGLGIKPSGDLYVALLKTRFVEDYILAKFNLQSIYRSRRFSDARRKLESKSTISASKDGVITVSVEDRDPSRAAQMANAYGDRLQFLTSQLAITEAARRRQVFELQINKTKTDLATAESDLNQMQKKSGLLQPETQARSEIYAVATLRAQIAASEVEAGVLKSYETSENPNVAHLDQQIAGMRAQLAELERKQNAGGGDIQMPTAAVPDIELEYLRRFREVKLQEALYELLMKQYEAARLDEAREGPLVQVIDGAIEPDKKTFPKLGLISLGGAALGFFLSIFLLVFLDARRRALQRSGIRERILSLEQELKWKS
jgi:tyrosine-protein kinase Etk/Wzc